MDFLPCDDPHLHVEREIQFIAALGLIVVHLDLHLALRNVGVPVGVDALAEVALEGEELEVTKSPDFNFGIEGLRIARDDKLEEGEGLVEKSREICEGRSSRRGSDRTNTFLIVQKFSSGPVLKQNVTTYLDSGSSSNVKFEVKSRRP